MAHLGEFGRELAALDAEASGAGEPPADTFTVHGETFVVPPHLSVLPRLRHAHAALEVAAAGDRVEAMLAAATTEEQREAAAVADHQGVTAWRAACFRYARDVIGGEGTMPEQWARFEELVARDSVDLNELLAVVNTVVEAASRRPRTRSSVSPSGPSATGGGSTAGSDSTAGPAPVTGQGGEPAPQAVETAPQAAETAWTPAQQQREALTRMMQPVAEAARS